MTGQAERLDVDALVCATGFRPNDIRDLLGGAAECFRFDENGPVVGRNYRLEAVGDIRPGVYLNGGVEATHGLSSSLLSCIAVRAGEILESVQHSGMTVAQ
jgi:L-ornithine N5-oxygenase